MRRFSSWSRVSSSLNENCTEGDYATTTTTWSVGTAIARSQWNWRKDRWYSSRLRRYIDIETMVQRESSKRKWDSLWKINCELTVVMKSEDCCLTSTTFHRHVYTTYGRSLQIKQALKVWLHTSMKSSILWERSKARKLKCRRCLLQWHLTCRKRTKGLEMSFVLISRITYSRRGQSIKDNGHSEYSRGWGAIWNSWCSDFV